MIKIVVVEDSLQDVNMINRHLRDEFDFELIHVDNEKDYRAILEKDRPDVILCDYLMHRFTGEDALDIRNKTARLVPFILVTASVNEETAVEMIKKGATDYVTKEHLVRLPAAIRHGMREMMLEKKKTEAETELKERERLFKKFVDNDIAGVYMETLNEVVFCNKRTLDIFGFESLEELNDFGTENLYCKKSDRKTLYDDLQKNGRVRNFEVQMRTKTGEVLYIIENAFAGFNTDNKITNVYGYLLDVTKPKKNEEEVRETTELFRSFSENSTAAILIYDADGFYFVNDATVTLTGYTKSELLKMDIFSLVHPEDKPLVKARAENRLAGKGVPKAYDFRIITKQGKTKWVTVSGGPFVYKGKKAAIATLIEVTFLRQLQDEKNMLLLALEQSPVSIVVTDLDANIEYVNEYFTELTGYSRKEVAGQNPRILQSGKTDPEVYNKLWQHLTNGKVWEGEFINRKKSGEEYVERARITPVFDGVGKIVRYLAIKEDITLKKNYEKQLILAKEKAEEADKLKTNFLANVSHELRTPLNGILGFAELMLMEESPEVMHQMAGFIKMSSLRLLNTLNLVIDYSILNAEHVRIVLMPVDLVSLIKEVVNAYSDFAEEKNLFLNVNTDREEFTVVTDKSIVEKVLTNLVDNAIKFTRSGGVSVSLNTVDFEETGEVEIRVRDTGIGIDPAKIPVIFEPFRQESEGYGREFEGIGLGLSVSKRMARALDGDITVESRKGKGSVFTFVFKAADKNGRKTGAKISEKKIGDEKNKKQDRKKKPRILYVDDDLYSLRFIKTLFGDKYILDTAGKYEKAMEFLEAKNYDLLIFDINLGNEKDGLMLLKKVLANPKYKDTPKLALTAFASNEDRGNLLDAGFDDYLAKPVRHNQMVEAVERLLGKKNSSS